MSYGIGYDWAYKTEEIGKKFNLTRERINQIREKALRKLRKRNKENKLGEYMGIHIHPKRRKKLKETTHIIKTKYDKFDSFKIIGEI